MSQTGVGNLDTPRVRYLDAFPIDSKGQRLIYLRDPEGISEQTIAVPIPAYYLITLFDGEHSVADLKGSFAEQFEGHEVTEEQIAELISQLDEACFLDSPRYASWKKAVEQEFREADIRKAAHAGASYPDDPAELRELIDSFFDQVERQPQTGIEGLIAPHIDFNRGGPCFASSYGALPQEPPAERFVVFGTGHSAARPFVMCRKDFETPFGSLKADTEVIDRIAERLDSDPFEDELSHRAEHSIEFQTVFLKYLYPHADIKFVPILCGSMQPWVSAGVSPMSSPHVADFIEAVRGALEDAEGRTCFVAGVDFSHVGERFGDSEKLTDAFIEDVEACDHQLLDKAEGGDPEGFLKVIAREEDRTRVCGTSSIYTMLHLLPGRRGTLLHYDKAVDLESQSMVSFAGMAFGNGA